VARKVVVEMVDDVDGTVFGDDGESIHYAVEGVEYVIDLKDEHAKELRETFEYYIAHSTRVGGRKLLSMSSGGGHPGWPASAQSAAWADCAPLRPAPPNFPALVAERRREHRPAQARRTARPSAA
jgi:hypothetical protein